VFAGAIVYVGLIAIVATTTLCAVLAMTRMSVQRLARQYVTVGYQRATAVLESTIVSDLQKGAVPNPAPSFAPIPPQCADAACRYTTAETIALTQVAPATPGPVCDPSESNCAQNVQINPYVDEGRLTAHLTITVQDRSGAVVVTRGGDVTLRLMSAPPYVVPAGSRESTFDDVIGSNAPGDDGGTADTSIRAKYCNDTTGVCTDASSWANASYDVPAEPSW
jgi:hypothetical protein